MCLAVPGKILSIEGDDPLLRNGEVSFGGLVGQISLYCVPDAREGDYVLVHAGFAITVLEKEEADRVYGYLRQMGDLAGPAEPDD